MSGIKDLHGLLFWMDNSTGPSLHKVLSDRRKLAKRKQLLLQQIESENRAAPHFLTLPPGEAPTDL